MEEQLVPFNDDWGPDTVPSTSYPALPPKNTVSKSVQKRREKNAKYLQKMINSTVLLSKSVPEASTKQTPATGKRKRKRRGPRLVNAVADRASLDSAVQPTTEANQASDTNLTGATVERLSRRQTAASVLPASSSGVEEPAERPYKKQRKLKKDPQLKVEKRTANKTSKLRSLASSPAASELNSPQAAEDTAFPQKTKKAKTLQAEKVEVPKLQTAAKPSSEPSPRSRKASTDLPQTLNSRSAAALDMPGQTENKRKKRKAQVAAEPEDREKESLKEEKGEPAIAQADRLGSQRSAVQSLSSRRERAEAAAKRYSTGHRSSLPSIGEKSVDRTGAAEEGMAMPASIEVPTKAERTAEGKAAQEVNKKVGGETAEKVTKKIKRKSKDTTLLPDAATAEELPAAKKTASLKSKGIKGGEQRAGCGDVSSQEQQMEDLGSQAGRKEMPGLLEKMAARLSGSRFRWLNETLYTTTGDDAFELMQEQPELFEQYHKGFEEQTKAWPQQPVDVAITWLKGLPRSLRVADFGCGNAALALAVPQKVACLDLVAMQPGVIECNMSDTPLESASMDVAVFCLALMGTDYPSFLKEATRVLKPNGRLWIAEVRSRFAPGRDSEDVRPFLAALSGLGYELLKQDASNKMFVVFELRKAGTPDLQSAIVWPELKACMYKRR